ncbi:YopJ/AvrA family T3SS effector serine/threonine acetyltransferase [Bartonella jaculi]|uniref:Type III secretion system YopJ family effector YopP n=1 Tax=Bartonella jaculi TaxID=686226 RepID=A0ABP9N643_9HYPH
MKPQDSKSSAQSSSSVQGADIENESLESLLARLEQLNTEKEKNIPFDHEKLQDIITGLEKDIADGSWIKKDYAHIDLKLMPALIEQANLKYPRLDLKFATSSEELCLSIKEAIDNGVQSCRHIVNMKEKGMHFAVIDHRTIENKTSLIFFESATLKSMNPAMLALRTQMSIKSQLPDCRFSIVEMDIQRSSSECGIFSLALAKKLHTEAGKLTRMHKDNIDGVLCQSDAPLPSDKLDAYLPVSFFKHTQSRRRLEQYVKSHPGAENEKVNKKDKTLAERFDKNLVTTEEEKTVSVSAHRKRVKEYKSLLSM